MLTKLRNRGVADVCIVCCDGPKGLPDAIPATWPVGDGPIVWCICGASGLQQPAVWVEGAR